MLKLQWYLTNNTATTREEIFEGLERQYAIAAKQHAKYPNLWLFKYDQIHSPMQERIVQEARGIILDEDTGWSIVSRGFDKFFNQGEGHAAKIDWETAEVQEKVDGSLCVVYPYDNQWHVATSGTPDASGDINKTGRKFADLFWETFKAQGGKLPECNNCCFFFELTSPENRVVVVHEKARLTSLGMRNLKSTELPAYNCQYLTNIPCVKIFELNSFEDIAESFRTISPLSQEGYVVVDRYYNRVKVKHPGYVALHHAKDGMNEKAFLEIVRAGETSEVLTAFPEFKPMFEGISLRFEGLVKEIENDYEKLKAIQYDKEFALEALKTRCSAALFAMRRAKTGSIRRFFAEMRIDSLKGLIDANHVS